MSYRERMYKITSANPSSDDIVSDPVYRLAQPGELDVWNPRTMTWTVPNLHFPFEVYVRRDQPTGAKIIRSLTTETITLVEREKRRQNLSTSNT